MNSRKTNRQSPFDLSTLAHAPLKPHMLATGENQEPRGIQTKAGGESPCSGGWIIPSAVRGVGRIKRPRE